MILETAFMCMALNIYHEAKFQSMLGQIAVGQVVMNRVEDSRFPDNVCDVVTQAVTYKGTDKPVLHKCQFSWYCDGKADDINHISIYLEIMSFTQLLLSSQMMMFDITDGATFYHADYVTPSWARSKIKTIEIGDHIFYRWKRWYVCTLDQNSL